MQPKRSSAALLQYALMVVLVILLVYLLNRRVSPLVFTTIFLVGVILAALPSILSGYRRAQMQDRFPNREKISPSVPAGKRSSAPDRSMADASLAESFATGETGAAWSIRPITDADLLEVAALLRKAFEEYRGLLNPPSGAHEESAEQLRLVLKDSRALIAVVKNPSIDANAPNDRIVGCVFYQFLFDHVYLFRLAVLPGYRCRGIGHALIQQVEDITRYADIHLIQLGVRTQLPENQAFYEKLGYKVLRYEAHKAYPEPTVAILQKSL